MREEPILLSRNRSTARARGLLYKATGLAPHFHQRVKHLDASLLHAHFAVDAASALALAAAIQRPMIVTLHGNDVTTTEASYSRSTIGRLYLAHRNSLWKSAAIFLCISDFLRSKAIERGFPESRLRVHYIGIDLDFFSSRAPAVALRFRQSVLFVARLVEKKGCTYLIKAMQAVQGRFPQAHLVIIGDGPERAGLEAQARDLGVNCEFRGAQPGSVIREELQCARVFCVPSVVAKSGDSEGLGIVFAEAQAMGVPVVSTIHGGIPEVVLNGRTGLLAPEQNHAVLAEHIMRFFADETFWQDCSRKAATWISDKFDIRRQTAQLEEIYREVIQTTPKGPR